MSTKKLSRTVLESGRAGWNKFERHQSTRDERAHWRNYLSRVTVDPEEFEENETPTRRPVRRVPGDKLSPVYRWLDKRVGKSWAKTRKLMAEKFDDRTLAGFHILHQHMLDQIGTESQEGIKEPFWGRHRYYVDNNDILRHSVTYRPKVQPFDLDRQNELVEWLDNRSVGYIKGVLYWFKPTQQETKAHWTNYYGLDFPALYPFYRRYSSDDDDKPNFVVERKLDKEEVNYFRSLPERIRNKLIETSAPRSANIL